MKEPYNSIIHKLLKLLKEKFGEDLISLAIFGSVASGDNKRDSDIDFFYRG